MEEMFAHLSDPVMMACTQEVLEDYVTVAGRELMRQISIEPVTEPIARHAAALLADAGLHGHKHAFDAMLSATALAAPGPVTILTSDPEDLTALCGGRATVIKV